MRRIGVRIGRMRAAMLSVTYHLEGALERIRVPPSAPARFVDGLWRTTCCELFIRSVEPHTSAYHELNLSPSGEWAAYAFDDYRAGQAALPGAEPALDARSHERGLILDATVDLTTLDAAYLDSPLAIALSAVVESDSGELSYWGLSHPADRPDFHHPSAFALTLT